MQGGASGGALTSYVIPLAVVAVVVALRWRRMSQVRPLRLERLWIAPAAYLVLCIVMYSQRQPVGVAWLFCLAAAGIGAALGWQRGKTMRIAINPETHRLNQTGSPAAMLFLLALVAVRSGARVALGTGGLALDPLALTDILMALALGLFTATRVEMFLRARRMLASERFVA